MRLNLGEIATSLGCTPGKIIWDGPGHVEYGPWAGLACTGAQVDSRKIQPGNLFFCLPGERTDGHDFARDAAGAGAIAIVASRNPWIGKAPDMLDLPDPVDVADLILPPVFLVDDVRAALARVAKCHRESCRAKVIGITGTAGKTSVKEVLAQVLAMRGRTERNPLNLNNQIGLPVSMLNASADASFWVMEAGISEAGDMDELGQILRPDIAIILNVGDGHVSGLGECGVAFHKARLLDYIQPGGTAVVSLDYADLNRQVDGRIKALSRRGIQLLRFSVSSEANPGAEVQARAAYVGFRSEPFAPVGSCSEQAGGGGIYKVWTKDFDLEVSAPFRGDFGSENVAAIVTVAVKLGLSLEEIQSGFAQARPPQQRLREERYPRHTLLDDSYNANPLSAPRMIQAARSMAGEYGQSLALVMGEMLELGAKAESAHEALGESMAAARPVAVFWKGGHADDVLRGLTRGGYDRNFYPLSDAEEFGPLLEEADLNDVLILFKGSRSNKLERLVAVFREKISPAGEN